MQATANAEAFTLYLEAERLFTVVVQSDMDQCREKFRLVTEMDPTFARAWGWRSYAHVRSVLRGWLPETELQVAGEWANQAVSLDPIDYACHWDKAFHLLNSRRFSEALESYESAIDLYDGQTDLLDRKPGVLAEAAEAFVHAGEPDRAIALLERAMRIPDWYRWNLGFAYYQAKRFDDALVVLQGMRSRPGDRSYVPDAVLFTIATYYRKSISSSTQGDEPGADALMTQATTLMRQFRVDNPEFSLDDALAHRSRFKSKIDEAFWFEPLQTLWDR
jgi:tetratricopeptide (TPR) repeat protein